MKDELVSFETAKLAKEKGFNIDSSDRLYHTGWYQNEKGEWFFDTFLPDLFAPTQSLLQKWLREKGIIVVPIYGYGDNPNWSVHIEVIEWMKKDENSVLLSGVDFEPSLYETYEDALEKGLYESLKLIK